MTPEETGGMVIDRYHLLQKIGEGGMGEVWLAEQKEPVRRRVALKLIKAGMNTREVIARFESERQALALMDHPAIAKVLDAGSTPQGAPYFVMEYVAGVPITDYCDKHRLSTRERLELFVRVCEGVQHAHQKAIIHRDLKPTNILVTEIDGRAAPKIIDFGVAKALTQKLTADTMFTRVGAIIGTPEYMSPEQALSSGEDIDTRTDVYSLGIIFYELLAGVPPIELRKIAFDEFLRRLREDEPPKPSTKIRTQDDATSADVARKRQTEPLALAKEVRGDLDSIALKALEKDRSRRYGTPSELAADIARYIRNEPVVARPASTGYRLKKYVRRHRLGVAMAAGLALLLAGSAVMEAVQLRLITQERDRFDRIAQFMRGMFESSAPDVAHRNNVTAREVLDKASKDLDSKMYADPKFQALMKLYLGEVYSDMGRYSQAQTLLDSSMKTAERAYGPDDPVTLEARATLAWSLQNEGRVADADALVQRVLAARRRLLGPDTPATLTSMIDMIAILNAENRIEDAEKLAREALELSRRKLGPEADTTLRATFLLGETLSMKRQYSELDKLMRELIPIERRLYGPDSSSTLDAMQLLSEALHKQGRYAENEALLNEMLEIQDRVFGPEHPATLHSRNTLVRTLRHEAKYAEAEKIARQTLEIHRRVSGPNHRDTAYAAETLGLILSSEDRYGEAKPLMAEAVRTSSKNGGLSDIILAWYNFACAAARGAHSDEALDYLQHAIDAGLPPSDHPENDEDLKSLRANPRFIAMVQDLQKRARVPSTVQ
jgi:tetratricopeptide (TPR) repeat protein